jgi:hypothetical protein
LNTFGREHEERSVTQSNFDISVSTLSFTLSLQSVARSVSRQSFAASHKSILPSACEATRHGWELDATIIIMIMG